MNETELAEEIVAKSATQAGEGSYPGDAAIAWVVAMSAAEIVGALNRLTNAMKSPD